MSRLYTGVQAVYWCPGCILVYRLYTGVQAVYWCTGCILVYRLYTGVQAVYWCTGCIQPCEVNAYLLRYFRVSRKRNSTRFNHLLQLKLITIRNEPIILFIAKLRMTTFNDRRVIQNFEV